MARVLVVCIAEKAKGCKYCYGKNSLVLEELTILINNLDTKM